VTEQSDEIAPPEDGEGPLELPDMASVDRPTTELVPPAEATRRGLILSLGLGFVALLALQLTFGLALNADQWARIGPILTTFTTVVAGGLGAAMTYYFTRDR
jgi:hypothetical protein